MSARTTIESSERWDVGAIRQVLQHWPLPYGKGWLMRRLRPYLDRQARSFEVEKGVHIPCELDDYMVYWAFVNGMSADDPWALSRKVMQPGDTIVDIGANVGLWLLGAARIVGPAGSAHGIEADADNIVRLQRNLELNELSWVRTRNVAISNVNGDVTLYRPRYGNSGHPTLGQRDSVDLPVVVPAMTLDAYCDETGLSEIAYLKIDVEGAELLVLQGAKTLLASKGAPIIQFEVNEETAGVLGHSCAAVKALLAEHGYRSYEIYRGRLREVSVEALEPPRDLIAWKGQHLSRVARFLQ